MKLTLKNLRNIVIEAISHDYVVRAGADVLFRHEGEKSSDWRWIKLDKVTYFSVDELIRGPSAPTRPHVWEFKRGNNLYAVYDESFYSRPEWKYQRRF
jgi:hypothetical protein